MTAAHRGTGAGMGNTKTLSFGLIIANTPHRAKTAPEAPIDKEGGGKINA